LRSGMVEMEYQSSGDNRRESIVIDVSIKFGSIEILEWSEEASLRPILNGLEAGTKNTSHTGRTSTG
jgi:hypothetical protein